VDHSLSREQLSEEAGISSGTRELKGFAEPVPVFRVVAQPEQVT
jgi:class 3 adenylate cyclase